MTRAYEIERLRDYASLFSSQVCVKAMKIGYASDVITVYNKFDARYLQDKGLSYWDYLKKVYSVLLKYYRNEYVYKNEVLNQVLIRTYGLHSTIAINEFGVGGSIVDLALFNGSSKAFEIKSDLDSAKRLEGQIADYLRLFDECFIVVPLCELEIYRTAVDDQIGIISLGRFRDGRIVLEEQRPARKNSFIDVDTLMSSVRSSEYKWMVISAFGHLPQVNDFEMFEACKEKLSRLSSKNLKNLFLQVIKRRTTITGELGKIHSYARQMCLAMNTNSASLYKLKNIYDNLIGG